ncbi:hypothetical protein TOPH_08789 [Tolypocladium ophioglossoides CBS 100239]|uniref:Mitochondrial inner membrane protein 1 n=1 Tax=Tolypocladium ophioglossoides (strain CBS 100239) TaxID=1163406 RepID=A0A0L0MXV0_TOLOC|nr:hypothetical protein TOPH_08789 [Tolypocladium ophioglossoides CBS 100239]
MFRASRPLPRLTPRAYLASSTSRAPPRTYSLALQPLRLTIARFASSRSNPPVSKQPIDREHEKRVAQEAIKPRPGDVSSGSSVRHVMEDFSSPGQDEANLGGGLKHDIGIVKDTFRLSQVPRESHILGLAGTVPYLATSLSTVFLAWNLTKNVPSGNSLYDVILVNHETARHLLSVIEPLQLGYGAVIISFLGAIHWGLEYAEKKPAPERTRFRYGMGVAASVVAWPTLFMPVEYALTTQFMAFVALYFADARAAMRGWAPYWYGTYRLLLTAMVGVAIIVSLVGHATISEHGKLSSRDLKANMSQPGLADTKTDWAKLEAEEKEKIKKEKEEAEKKAKKSAKKKSDSKDSSEKGNGKDIRKGDEKKNDKQPEKGSEKQGGKKDGGKDEQKEGQKKNDQEVDHKKDDKRNNQGRKEP